MYQKMAPQPSFQRNTNKITNLKKLATKKKKNKGLIFFCSLLFSFSMTYVEPKIGPNYFGELPTWRWT